LSDAQKRRILERLATRIDKHGVLRVTSQAERTQARNEVRARRRLVELLRGALQRQRKRIATRPTRAAEQRRVETKKRRAAVKRTRRKPRSGDT
jgi:ribosome-associated protein